MNIPGCRPERGGFEFGEGGLEEQRKQKEARETWMFMGKQWTLAQSQVLASSSSVGDGTAMEVKGRSGIMKQLF